MNAKTIAALVVFGIAAVISFFLRGSNQAPATAAADLPDGYYLKGVALTGTDAMGEVQYRLRADRIDHHPADGSIDLGGIALTYGNPEAPWTLRAAEGSMPPSNDRISLKGGVEIRSGALGADRSGTTRIDSDTLEVDILAHTASTASPVRISAGPNVVTGTGLEVDFTNETVAVLSDIKGAFDPAPEPPKP